MTERLTKYGRPWLPPAERADVLRKMAEAERMFRYYADEVANAALLFKVGARSVKEVAMWMDQLGSEVGFDVLHFVAPLYRWRLDQIKSDELAQVEAEEKAAALSAETKANAGKPV